MHSYSSAFLLLSGTLDMIARALSAILNHNMTLRMEAHIPKMVVEIRTWILEDAIKLSWHVSHEKRVCVCVCVCVCV